MRDPGLHISEKALVGILKEALSSNNLKISNDILGEIYFKKLAKLLVTLGKRNNLSRRTIHITNAKLERKANKIRASKSDDAILMSTTITTMRRAKKHRGITPIEMGSRDWPILKEITANALSFCKDFELSRRQGFYIYISYALPRLNKFSLNRIPNLHSEICLDYQAQKIINFDQFPQETKRGYEYYKNLIYEKTGFVDDISSFPQKYQYFVKVSEESKNIGVRIEDYIKAQFEGLSWANGIPDSAQMVGKKALERLHKYLYMNNIKINQKPVTKVNWDKIRQNGS